MKNHGGEKKSKRISGNYGIDLLERKNGFSGGFAFVYSCS